MDTIQNFDKLFSGLKATINTAKEYQKISDKSLALNFNPLIEFFGLNERKLSTILAFFLNPSASHGQGSIFLERFFQISGLEKLAGQHLNKFKMVSANLEHPTHEGRFIDILLNIDNGRFGIAVENKIWAKDQEDQLLDYSEYLDKYFLGNYCLLYVRPFDGEVDEWTIPKEKREELERSGKFVCFNHSNQTLSLIEAWIKDCEADVVRTFLKHLHQYLQHTINKQTFMGQNEIIADYLEQDIPNLEAALAIPAAIGEMFSRSLFKIAEQAESLAKRMGIGFVSSDTDFWDKNTGFKFVINGPNSRYLWIRFEFMRDGFKDYFYGVMGSGEEQSRRLSIEKALSDKIGLGSPDEYWSWWRWHEKRNDPNAILMGVYDGSFIKDVEEKLNLIIPAVREILNSDILIE